MFNNKETDLYLITDITKPERLREQPKQYYPNEINNAKILISMMLNKETVQEHVK